MDFAVVPYPTPDWPIDVTWPLIGQLGVGTAFQVAGNPKYGIATTYSVFDAVSGTATNNMTVHRDLFCGQFTCDGAGATSERGLGGFSMYLPLTKGTLPSGFTMPDQYRVQIVSQLLALNADVEITAQSGFGFAPASGVGPGWFAGAGNNGYGLIGGGVGQLFWRWRVQAGGAVTEEIMFDGAGGRPAWPAARTEWCLVSFVHYAATAGADARVELWLNATRVLSRSWGAGTVLPTYAAPANAARFAPQVRAAEPALAAAIMISGLRFRCGGYDQNGAKVS